MGLLSLVGIQSLFPLLSVGFVTNDDLKLSNAVLDRGIRGAATVLWSFTRRDGRLDIAQMASWYLPFAFDSFVYFKAVSLTAIAADILLFGWFLRRLLGSGAAFYLAVLLVLVGLQNSWEHTPLVAFPGLFTFTFAYLLGSFLAFQHYLERRSAFAVAASAGLFLLTIASYEMYLIYVPVFFGLALLAGRTPGRALRAMALHLFAVAVHLTAWSVSHAHRTGNYAGVTVAQGLDLDKVAQVVWQFSVSSLPTYLFFSAKYDYLLDAARRTSALPGLLSWLTAGAIVKALIAGGVYVFLLARARSEAAPLGPRRVLALLAAALFFFFAPSVLPGLTVRYQEEVKQQLGMQCSYFSLFAAVLGAVALLLGLARLPVRPAVRWLWIVATALPLMAASVVVDYTNAAVGEWQARGRERFVAVNRFLRSPAYDKVAPDSVIYAPSLWRSIATINFVGAAIDPAPSLAAQYRNFWTFYFTKRGGKPVSVTDRLESIPANMGRFFVLRQVRAGTGRYLVFASAERSQQSPGLLLTDFALIYDLSALEGGLVGGSLAETGGRPVTVGLVSGETVSTSERFLLELGNHFQRLGPERRMAVQAERPAIDVDSVFLAPSAPADLTVVKSSGWMEDGWIGAEAHATLPLREPSRLVLDAYVPDYVFRQVGFESLTLGLEVDGVPVLKRVVSAGGRMRLEANLDPSSPGDLTVRCGPVHRPMTFGIAPDSRELCMVVERVVLRRRERGE